jgi:hypothetical protein
MADRTNDQNREKAIAVMVAFGVRPAALQHLDITDVTDSGVSDAE